MKILVFDDSPVHREAAVLTLAGHDLTVVSTYDEAQKALTPVKDYESFRKLHQSLLEKAGLAPDFYPVKRLMKGDDRKLTSEQDNTKYYETERLAEDMTTTYPDFDVVLTDLMVPASAQACSGSELVGTEMPIGTTIALLALVVGVKKVAVVTDMNHHKHPASAAFDCFRWIRASKSSSISVICTNGIGSIWIDEATGQAVSGFRDSEEGKKKYPYVYDEFAGCDTYKGLRRGKNWVVALKQLLGELVE